MRHAGKAACCSCWGVGVTWAGEACVLSLVPGKGKALGLVAHSAQINSKPSSGKVGSKDLGWGGHFYFHGS